MPGGVRAPRAVSAVPAFCVAQSMLGIVVICGRPRPGRSLPIGEANANFDGGCGFSRLYSCGLGFVVPDVSPAAVAGIFRGVAPKDRDLPLFSGRESLRQYIEHLNANFIQGWLWSHVNAGVANFQVVAGDLPEERVSLEEMAAFEDGLYGSIYLAALPTLALSRHLS